MTEIYFTVGFLLAAYAIVANDSIQTLGTFLASNAKRPWWVLALFTSSIMVGTILYGNFVVGDPTYGRLNRFPAFEEINFNWYHLLGPIAILALTRIGFPVSTSFLVLVMFSASALGGMLTKSLMGYAVAFGCGLIIYVAVMRIFEKKWTANPYGDNPPIHWIVLQWCSTGWLWHNWLKQDLANIFVYLPRPVEPLWLIAGLVWMIAIQAYIFRSKGGKIQQVVLQKSNTTDIRAATIVDFLYGTILFYFKNLNDLPMSTTWVFIGLLAGRELGLRLMTTPRTPGKAGILIAKDLGKAATGLAISILIALSLPWLAAQFGG